MSEKYVPVEAIVGFVQRTTNRGVPMRIALTRAQRRYGVSRGLIRSFLRGTRRGN